MLIQPEPTRTFVIDIGRKCNLNCKFCYYRQLGDLRVQGWRDINKIYQEVRDGISRGNNRVEITGGEPTLYPYIVEAIDYMRNNSLEVCVITNGIVSEVKLCNIIDAGAEEFLLSIHGTEETHNFLTSEGARKAQEKTINILQSKNLKNGYRFNFVINRHNQSEILKTAEYMAQFSPTIVNFINMNPHHLWQNDPATKEIIADLRIVETQLNKTIEYLNSVGIDVNVRYYPMCRIAEEHRGCICNDLHVMFDSKEWDYCTTPKTFNRYRQWGIDTSKDVEEKGTPCKDCDLQWICGGANKHFHRASNAVFGELLIPQKIPGIEKDDFFCYRRERILIA